MSHPVALVTDSTACMPKELLDKYHISVAPQVLIWNGDTYEDGVNIQPEEFYRRLMTAKIMPTSSQVTPGSFTKVFKQLTEEGYDILALLISAKLSGTITSAEKAKELFPQANIEILDTRSTAMGTGFPVLQAARAAEAGASLQDCKRIAEECCNHIGIFLTVDTL